MVVFLGSLIQEIKKLLGDSRDEEATEKIYIVKYLFFCNHY